MKHFPSPAMANQEAEFWSKLKQMEVQFWQVKNAAADTTNQMRNWIKAAFQTLESVSLFPYRINYNTSVTD